MYKYLLERPFFYNLWSTAHFAPRMRQIDALIKKRDRPRILDLGCGTALFKKYFRDCEYTGIDFNPRYIDHAKKRYEGTFLLGDITSLNALLDGAEFDYIILNGILHHIDTEGSEKVLGQSGGHVAPDGRLIVVDLVDNGDLNRVNSMLVRSDRGDHIRSRDEYESLFAKRFLTESYNEFTVNAGPLPLWKLAAFLLKKR